MTRYLPAVLLALLVLVAGCAGTFPSAGDAAGPTGQTDPTDGAEPAPSGAGGGAVAPAGSPADMRAGGGAVGVEAVASDGLVGSVVPGPSYGASQPLGAEGTVSVSGVGQVSVDPDLAIVTVAVQGRADTAEAAREAVARDAQRMREALRQMGVPDEDVRTTYYYLSPRYDYDRDREELIGYVATHGFQIRTAVDEAGAVVDTAVGNGADQVNGVQFTLTDRTQRELRAQALSNAVVDARSDADAIASAAGLSITGVHSASTSSPVVTPYVSRMAEAAGADGQTPTVFDTGPVTVTASVSIAYTVE